MEGCNFLLNRIRQAQFRFRRVHRCKSSLARYSIATTCILRSFLEREPERVQLAWHARA